MDDGPGSFGCFAATREALGSCAESECIYWPFSYARSEQGITGLMGWARRFARRGGLYMGWPGAQDAGVGGGCAAGGRGATTLMVSVVCQPVGKSAAFMVREAGRGLQELCRGVRGGLGDEMRGCCRAIPVVHHGAPE